LRECNGGRKLGLDLGKMVGRAGSSIGGKGTRKRQEARTSGPGGGKRIKRKQKKPRQKEGKNATEGMCEEPPAPGLGGGKTVKKIVLGGKPKLDVPQGRTSPGSQREGLEGPTLVTQFWGGLNYHVSEREKEKFAAEKL